MLLFLVFSSSCENDRDGEVDPQLDSPYLISVKISEDRINLDTTTNPTVVKLLDGRYRLSDSIEVQALDARDAGNLAECRIRLYKPGSNSAFLSSVVPRVSSFGNVARFSLRFSFVAARNDIGSYLIEAYVTRTSELESNHVLSSLVVTRNNARPQIANLSVPDTIRRPTTGFRPVFLAVSASDSDGLGDIQKVFFKSINSTSPSFEQPMFDDGDLNGTGDSVATDGRFSRLLTLDSSATLGTKEFRFWARDRSGALSDSLVHLIVVIPE